MEITVYTGDNMQKIWMFLVFFSALGSSEITGFWETTDQKTGDPTSVIAIYPYEGKYYGRIVATYNKEGILDDTIYHPKSRAPGIVGDPHYCGLDIVWHATSEDDDGKYSGSIVDPKEGKVYNAELWRDGENLILRGKLFVFWQDRTWPPFPESGFNATFKKPDLKTFVPKILKTKD
jgi:uncharacterized protein (DUF2147 family)